MKGVRPRILLFVLWGACLRPGASAAFEGTDLEFTTGYRRDRLEFNTGPGPYFWRMAVPFAASPNVMSELTWRNIQIFQAQVVARVVTESRIYSRGTASYGWVLGGSFQDSEFGTDNRGQEWSRANLGTGGRVVDLSYGLGYKFPEDDGPWMVAPLVGYAYHHQSLEMDSGIQTIAGCAPSPPFNPGVCSPPAGPISGANVTYTTEWYGPWTGLDAAVKAGAWRFNAGAEYHWSSTYLADMVFPDYPQLFGSNSREDYHHRALATGVVAMAGVRYSLNSRWSLSVAGRWEDWITSRGGNEFYFMDIFDDGSAPLHRVHWGSVAVSLGVAYKF